MKATILVDNYVPNKDALAGEPSFSCLIEDEKIKILFDVGMSAIPFNNAKKLKLDIADVSYIVLSHGHLDHSWGLENYITRFKPNKKITLLCHPDALLPKKYGRRNIGIKGDEKHLEEHFTILRSKSPYWITEKIVFLGEIERKNDFEAKVPIGKTKKEKKYKDDYSIDDSAIAIDGEEGIAIITGCSHSGICNITEYAKKIIGKEKIAFIVGGFHLQSEDENNELLKKTVEYLKGQDIKVLYPCHCTNLVGKQVIGNAMETREVGVGSVLEIKKI